MKSNNHNDSRAPTSVGVAKLHEDETLEVLLRASDENAKEKRLGDAMFFYKKDQKEYQDIINHVGGLKPGESKPIPPWLDD